MASAGAIFERQNELFGLISRAVENLNKIGVSNLSRGKIQSRIDNLDLNWTKFQAHHENLLKVRVEHENNPYFKSNLYFACEEKYLDVKSDMIDLLDELLKQSQQISTEPNIPPNQSSFLSGSRSHHLPKINLPTFSGNYTQWTNFRDLFSSMVGTNMDLSLVEKLHYLKMSLTDEPAQLLKNIEVNGDNFARAWEVLVERYENKRILIDSHLSGLFSLRRVKSESAHELKLLLGNVKEFLGALSALGCPVAHWDDVLVFMIIRKLDSDSLRDWEKSIGAKKNPVPFSELENFLSGRIHSLEAVEQITMVRKQPTKLSSSVKAHGVYTSQVCSMCKGDHYLSSCQQYLNKNLSQRKEFVTSKRLCFNCLGPHMLKDCRTRKRCRVCNRQHHSSLHNAASFTEKAHPPTGPVPSQGADTSTNLNENTTSQVSSNIAHSGITNTRPVLLATALIRVVSYLGESYLVRALIDQGSEVSFISESLAQTLRLPRRSANIPVNGIGSQRTATSRGIVAFWFSSRMDSKRQYSVNALVLKELTSYLPPKVSSDQIWQQVQHLSLADPEFSKPRPVDVILGADLYYQIIENGLERWHSDMPIAQKTALGWILSGPTTASLSNDVPVHGFQCSLDYELRDLIQRFWTQEEVQISSPTLTQDEIECEEHFRRTVFRDCDGRFVVKLPLKNPPKEFGNSYTPALRMLTHMEGKFRGNLRLKQQYSDFMQEYLDLGHMRELSKQSLTSLQFFLPHHGVVRDCSLTTKLRVVFNGSFRTSLGVSLNDHLHSGPKLQTELTDVLMRWRLYPVVFAADIEKMYRQIGVDKQDWPLQQILWRQSSDDPVKIFQLTTVTYGLTCAPFLAMRCLRQLADDHNQGNPNAANILIQDMYVDDILSGAQDVASARLLIDQLVRVLGSGGFVARKWISNNPDTLSDLPSDLIASSLTLSLKDELTFRTLGLTWNSGEDKFVFDWNPYSGDDRTFTKRNVLSRIAQMFDPLGWLSPVIVVAKRFMQELWVRKLEWDEEIPLDLVKQWYNFLQELKVIPTITIPRWLGLCSATRGIEIHGFSDASQEALGAVVYLRVSSDLNHVHIALLTAKTKVAPLKRVTVPRLELCAAVLLTRLVKRVQKTFNLSRVSTHLWCDSTVALAWIRSCPSRWRDFVRNRVTEIQDLINVRWRHVPGNENPADLASRGVAPSTLPDNSLWWTGPPWLAQPSQFWPATCSNLDVDVGLEEKAVCSGTSCRVVPALWDLINQYSGLMKLLRVTAWCIRFVKCCKRKKLSMISGYLPPSAIQEALYVWVRQTQQCYFSEEIILLGSQRTLPRSNRLHRLTPFIDGEGFLRLAGRLRFANLNWNEKHPLILPKECVLSSLIIDYHHHKTFHGGTQITLASIRRLFWIVGGRVPVRTFIHRCMRCARQKATTSQQLMGQLPRSRVTVGRPFLNSGIDYAGPFFLRTFRGRGAKIYKGYLVVFVCLATSAIHLEMVTDYTSAGFIAAYKRFTARRGICSALLSDCGTNLVGADRELKSLFQASSKEWKEIANYLSNDGTAWKFNPPSSPHFGGKWEAAVKAVKYHLKRVVGDTTLTYEEFCTLLTEIETILNSRPLCPLSDDPNSIDALTPGHFLIGSALSSIPEPSLVDVKASKLSRWQFIRKMMEQFWIHWTKYYLQHLQNSTKWFQSSHKHQIGSLVLIKDERFPPSKWPLARVLELHPGPDGLSRVATVKTQTTTLRRPIVKLCLLPSVSLEEDCKT